MSAMLANAPERAYVLEPECRIEGALHRPIDARPLIGADQEPQSDEILPIRC